MTIVNTIPTRPWKRQGCLSMLGMLGNQAVASQLH